MSYIGGPITLDEEDKEEKKPLGTSYVEKKREIVESVPVVGPWLNRAGERQAQLDAITAQRAKEGNLVDKAIGAVDQGIDAVQQTLALPFTATASLFNVNPEALSDALYVLPLLGKGAQGLARTQTAHNVAARLSQTSVMQKTGNLYQRLKNVPPSERVVNVPTMRGNQLLSETSASVIRSGSLFSAKPKSNIKFQEYLSQEKALARAEAGLPPVPGEVNALLSVRPSADVGAIGDLNLIPKAGALYGKMNRQGKAGKESGERIASKFASPLEITQFNKKYGGISRRLLGAVYTSPFAPHHLVPHEDAARINIRGDAEQVWTAINNLSPRKHTPGNVRENLIGAMHRKNAAFIQSGKESIIQQKPEWVQTSKPYTWNDPYLGELTSTPDRILKDIIKDPGDAPYPSEIKSLSSIGLPESGVWPSGNKVTPKQKAVAWKERFNYWGIDRKQVKFDPKGDIIGVDHVEIGHAAIKLHPKYKEMQELLNNRDLYLSKSAKEAAAIIEPGLRVAENVFININKLRLDLIKEHLGFLTRTGIDKNGRPKFKSNPTIVKQYEGQVTERIVTWIADNPAKAASLGGSLLTKDLNKMLKWLEKDPGKLTDEFNKVFSAEIQNEASMTEPPSSQQLSDLKDKFNK